LFFKERSFQLTRHGYDGRSRPEDVHAGRVAIAEGRVEAHVRQLRPAHVLFLGRQLAENEPLGGNPPSLRRRFQIRFAERRETEQPQN